MLDLTFFVTSIMLLPMAFISAPALAHPSGLGKSTFQQGPVPNPELYPPLSLENNSPTDHHNPTNHEHPPTIDPWLLELHNFHYEPTNHGHVPERSIELDPRPAGNDESAVAHLGGSLVDPAPGGLREV